MRSIARELVAFWVLLGFLAAFTTHPVLAGDTHFRYGHYFWTQVDSDTIEITIQNAWRRDGYSCVDAVTLSSNPCSPGDGLPQIGDIIAEFIGFTQFDWGDGTAPVGSPIGPLLFLVTSIDPDENWLFGLALNPASLPAVDTTLSHTYAAPGDYTAFTDSCCRISAAAGINEHINNPDGGYRMETIINVGALNDSPVSALPPIVRCPIDALCSFVVPGIDPDGDVLDFRLAGTAEASSFGAFIQPGPPDAPNAASIDATTDLPPVSGHST